MNKYFLKDKKATVCLGVWEAGQYVYYPITENPVWCFTKQTTQQYAFDAGVSEGVESRMFVFNYNPLYNMKMLILYKGKQYLVNRCDRENDYNSDVFVYAETQTVLHEVSDYDADKIQSLING